MSVKSKLQLLDELLGAGPLRRADHPHLSSTIAHALRHKQIVAVLPGIYLPAKLQHHRELRRRAAMLWDPDAVIVGRSAAAEQFWPGLRSEAIQVASPRQHRRTPAPGYSVTRRRLPPEYVVQRNGVRYTSLALTAVDLCAELGDEAIDRALRTRRTTPELLKAALVATPARDGNRVRRAAILDATGNPWSYAERLAHKIFRDAGIHGWQGNPKLTLFGNVYYPDILFEEYKFVVEIDGRSYHSDEDAYQYDRDRRNDFQLSHHWVLQFTAEDVEHRPAKVARRTRQMLQSLGAS